MTGFDKFASDYKDKKILILGLGLLGRGVGDVILFASIGCELRISDLKNEELLSESLKKLSGVQAEYILGEHRREDVEWADVIVRNADVPWSSEYLEHARELGKEIVMDNQLFVKYAAGVTTIGITGTRGKTTTTKLIAHILKSTTDKQIILGGNVRGVATLPQLKTIKDPNNTIAVLELSSWQLQAFELHKQSVDIAVITNIYPDHLNRYPTMEEYEKDKQSIFTNQTAEQKLIINGKQDQLKQWAKSSKSEVIEFDVGKLPRNLSWKLLGDHNLENAAAAYEVCSMLGVSDEMFVETAGEFEPVKYRLEYVGRVNGAKVYNDSNSTTPVATIKALNSFDEQVVLILGGEDKNLPINEMITMVNEQCRKVVLLGGSGTDRIKNGIKSELLLGEYGEFETAVLEAFKVLRDEDTLLFSPGFTSFGMFNNEYERGDGFGEIVKRYQI